MNLLLAITIGVLTATAVVQILRRDLIRLVIGLYIFWNAANLFLIGVGSVDGVRAPFAGEGTGAMADPLVQALILTAIVISFGFMAFLLILLTWLVQRRNSIDVRDYDQEQG